MVEANSSSAAASENERTLMISSNNFIHLNEGNIKTFYKISSCIGRGKLTFFFFFLSEETDDCKCQLEAA